MYCFQILDAGKNRLIVDIEGVGAFSFKSSRDITRYFTENEDKYNIKDEIKFILMRPHVISIYLNTKYGETNRVYKKHSTTEYYKNIKGFNIYRINGKYLKNPRDKKNASTDEDNSNNSTDEENKNNSNNTVDEVNNTNEMSLSRSISS